VTTSLLATKLYFPAARLNLVSRPRLVARLQAGLQGPLTLLSAPAGSGKTMLLSEWRQGPGAQMLVAWLTLDAGDNNPETFFQYLCAALDGIKPGLAAQAVPLLSTNEPVRPDALLTLLVNALSELQQDCALVHKKLGDERQAVTCLQEALQMAEAEGHARPFIDLGEPLRELLRSAQRRGPSSDFVSRLLAAFARREAGQQPPQPAASPQVLSKRELKLVELIAAGYTNKEIASELVISLGTVKRHTVNIFTKLDVKNRTEAVAKAREMGLL
jgi:ATP/maltotriose-dependent transcriptional regulator MalT